MNLAGLRRVWALSRQRALAGTVAIVGPLAVGAATGNIRYGGLVSLGGFTAVYGHAMPYRRRGPMLAAVGIVLAAAASLGSAFSASPVGTALVLGAIAGTATYGSELWLAGPPGPVMVLLVAGTASAQALHAPAELSRASLVGLVFALTGVGAVVAWCVAMAPWLRNPTQIEERSVRAAVAAVQAFTDRPDPRLRVSAVKALRVARRALSASSRRAPATARRLEGALEEAQLSLLGRTRRDVGPDLAHEGLARESVNDMRTPRARSSFAHRAGPRSGVRERSTLVLPALRAATAVTAAGLVGVALSLDNIYWASLTALAVLQGPDQRATRRRAWHRMAGTLAGLAIAWVLLSWGLALPAVVAVIAVLQLLVEVVIPFNYWLAVTLFTPLALLLATIAAAPQDAGALVVLRLEETIVGSVAALSAGHLLWPRAASRRLADETAATLVDIASAVAAPRDAAAPVRLEERLLMLHDLALAARAELFAGTDVEERLERCAQAEDLGWVALGAISHTDEELLAAVRRAVRT